MKLGRSRVGEVCCRHSAKILPKFPAVFLDHRGFWWVNHCTDKERFSKTIVKISQLCLTLCNPVDYTVHGILQARILEWVAFPFSRGSFQPRDRTQVSRIAGGFFTSWATWEAQRLESWKQICLNLGNSEELQGGYSVESLGLCSSWV